MEPITDQFLSLAEPAEALWKAKGSKFYAYAFRVRSAEEIEGRLLQVRKKHHKARHHCYAWQLGPTNIQYRVNDDGEPSNSAGQPIYGQIKAYGLTEVLIVVVRYFGGVKLGVGGLIQAYKTSAAMALDNADIKAFPLEGHLEIKMDYPQMNDVMRLIKSKGYQIRNQELKESCIVVISVPRSKVKEALEVIQKLHLVTVKSIES